VSDENDFIYLVEIEVYDPDLPGTKTLRFTSSGGKTTKPTETPPNVHYEGRVLNPINFTRTAFSDSRVMGGAEIGYGEIVLSNKDQGLSEILNYGLDGRQVVIRTGPQDGDYPDDYDVFFTGTMRMPTVTTSQVRINLKDKLAILDLPIQTTKYAGTNTAGSGKEGVEDDIKDNPKPLLYGRCFEVSPILVNTSKYIYQIHDGVVDAVETVKDSGIALTFGTNRANLAAMEASAPLPGYYDTCTSEGLIRINAPAAGKITVTARGDKTGGVYVNKIADIISRILIEKATVVSADIDSTSVSTLNTLASYEVGIFVDSEESIQSVVDKLLISAGAWLAPNKSGQWAFGQLRAPSGTPVQTFLDEDILSLELQSSDDENKSIPVHRVSLSYGKRWTSFSESDLAATVSTSDKNTLKKEWRVASGLLASVKTKHLLSPELKKECLINAVLSAALEANRVLTLHSVRRDFVNVDLRLNTDSVLIDIGSVIELKTARLDYSAGKLFYVVGITSDGSRNKMSLQLWG